MTIERSHSKQRVTGARLRDVTAPQPAASAPSRSDVRPYRAARRHLLAALTSRVDRGVSLALAGNASPETGAEIARRALSLYRGGCREVNTQSPIALSHLLRWAVGTAVSQHLALAAADTGPATPEGRAMLELSMKLEGRAERASVAALTIAEVLRPQRKERTALDIIEERAKRAIEARRGEPA